LQRQDLSIDNFHNTEYTISRKNLKPSLTNSKEHSLITTIEQQQKKDFYKYAAGASSNHLLILSGND